MLDLGAFGKGYAVERAVEILREGGVTSAILHGGTSTVYALGRPPDAEVWRVSVMNPSRPEPPSRGRETEASNQNDAPLRLVYGGPEDDDVPPLATVPLQNEAMSVSAIWGRWFETGGRTFGHVIDPRSGEPVEGPLLAGVVLPSAAETDALSTALLVRGREGHEVIGRLRPDMKTLLVTEAVKRDCFC
jgi:thiamine biosynthesis lipoprotein